MDVGIWAEWDSEVEADPVALASAVEWLVGYLVRESEANHLPPIGSVTIANHSVESGFGEYRIRRAVNLEIDPVALAFFQVLTRRLGY